MKKLLTVVLSIALVLMLAASALAAGEQIADRKSVV